MCICVDACAARLCVGVTLFFSFEADTECAMRELFLRKDTKL
jgi:hypothetical protein